MVGLICFFIEEVYVGTPFLKKTSRRVKTFFVTLLKNILSRIDTNDQDENLE